MRRTTLAAAGIATLVLALTSCSSGTSSDAGTEPATTTPSAPPSTPETIPVAATTPLEGTWMANLDRQRVIAYIRKAGWSKRVEKALLEPDMAGPEQNEFRLDFVGNRFRMSQAATDVQWQSGTYELKDDRTIWLDDEAPVGYLVFTYHLDGDTISFDQPTSDPAGLPDFMPGAPDWAPGAVMWATVPWHRDASR
jgi:hypothetical protein